MREGWEWVRRHWAIDRGRTARRQLSKESGHRYNNLDDVLSPNLTYSKLTRGAACRLYLVQGADRYLHPKPLARTRSAGPSRHGQPGSRGRGAAPGQRPSSAASFAGYGIGDRPRSAEGQSLRRKQPAHGGAERFDRHPAFYGNNHNVNQTDLQASVERLNMSDANVNSVINGLDQLKTRTGGRGGSGRSGGSGIGDSSVFDPRSLVSH